MIALFAFLAPIIAALLIYNFFRHDLKHARGLRKLKVGAVDALIRRHRIAAILHLVIFLLAIATFVFTLGAFGIVISVMWAIVFMGHMLALTRFSRQMMATMDMNTLISARLNERQSQHRGATINDDGELQRHDQE